MHASLMSTENNTAKYIKKGNLLSVHYSHVQCCQNF